MAKADYSLHRTTTFSQMKEGVSAQHETCIPTSLPVLLDPHGSEIANVERRSSPVAQYRQVNDISYRIPCLDEVCLLPVKPLRSYMLSVSPSVSCCNHRTVDTALQ
ncbi:hypothetical protein NX059_000622 [Plenodomus lindquistii]|nr:hypothetical protein NX059_000622 [Plenodomus lindquistii]